MLKKILVLAAAVLLIVSVSSAAVKIPASQLFQKGKMWITPQIGLYSWGGSVPFGANFETAITPNIGVGATAMAMFWNESEWSESIISLAGEVAYHFTQLKVDNLDLYAGGGLGYSIYSWSWKSGFSGLNGGSGASGIYIETLLGARYYLTPKIAVSLRLVGSLTGFSGFGSQIGVAFNLK
jgi:hypothetical protein